MFLKNYSALSWGVGIMGIVMWLNGCAPREMASDYVRPVSHAVDFDIPSALKAEFEEDRKSHPGQSGFRLVPTGTNAFLTHLAMLRMAQHSVDLQYYSIHNDGRGQIFLEEVLRAADRGVRVRMLIDDLNIKKIDATTSVFDSHPSIEVRSFNPLTTTGHPFWARMVHHLTQIRHYNRRMHNKVLIADNQVAILGGRNIGDSYFDASDEFNFSDMDVVGIGPIVPSISRSFDTYWNSEEAFPLEAVKDTYAPAHLQQSVRKELADNWDDTVLRYPKLPIAGLDAVSQLRGTKQDIVWAKAELSVDKPEKVQPDEETTKSPPMQRLTALLRGAQEEFIGVAPYLVPKEEGVRFLTDLVKRGVRVKLITNSLASTDVVPVHTAYNSYRRPLLKGGVELHELKPIPGKRTRQSLLGSSSRSSLHAKVYVVDKRDVVIGSFNLDPRSWELNTEMALIIHSPAIAKRISTMFEETTSPAMSYRLSLADDTESLQWTTQDKNGEHVYHSDPEPGFWRSVIYGAFVWLPLEDHL